MDNWIKTYQPRLNLQNATFSRIEHEEALVALVYKIISKNREQLILKICERPHDYLREVYFLRHFAKILPVPKIIQLVEPSEKIAGAILMRCLPGTVLKVKELSKSLAYEIGRYLAFIHLNRLSGYGDLIQDNLKADPRIYFTSKFDEGLNECKFHLPIKLMDQCYNYYKAHVDLLLTVDKPCLAHRDFRPGNLMINEGKL